jgi:hypothetical protein
MVVLCTKVRPPPLHASRERIHEGEVVDGRLHCGSSSDSHAIAATASADPFHPVALISNLGKENKAYTSSS